LRAVALVIFKPTAAERLEEGTVPGRDRPILGKLISGFMG
jgi:hypothetical protein